VKVLCDQDVPVPVLAPLRHLLQAAGHEVDHVNDLRWAGKKDRPLFADAKGRGYDCILTNDSNQLNDPAETDAIKRSGLHHIRYPHRHRGIHGLGLAMASILAAMPVVMRELQEAESQRLVRIAGVSPYERFTAVDPAVDPPRYWPR
jgi:hypothetical protein